MERQSNSSHCATEECGVLDIKPLKTLSPMFPAPLSLHTVSQSTIPPFVRINPFDTANNVAPSTAKMPETNGAINGTPANATFEMPTPLSFRKPPASSVTSDDEDEDISFSDKRSTSGRKIKRSKNLRGYKMHSPGSEAKRKRMVRGVDVDISFFQSSSNNPRESVEVVLMTFDALRRRILQLDEALDLNRRADLKSGAMLMERDIRANSGKRIGSVPGVTIGDIFYFRFELCLVGLHAPSMAGIDYMTARFEGKEEPVAVCIVSSGGYQNEDDDVDVLVYSGQGGSGKHDRKQPDDQKLERGNLALERSSHRKNEIRVIRSAKDASCPTGKIYIYDGLYKIEKSWSEKGKSGFNMFKYKLVREPGQPDGITVWKMAQMWKENPSSRGRVVLPDISSGLENIPVCLVNEVDNDQGTNHFTYVNRVQYPEPIGMMKPLNGCRCQSVCLPGDKSCSCAQQHGSDLPYNSIGLLVSRKPLIYECSFSCQCSFNCRNRVTQKGTKLHFEVFKTADRGWGLRSWDPIRAGTFICEYTGQVVESNGLDGFDDQEDNYIFQATYPGEKAMRWNHGPELIGETQPNDHSESFRTFPVIISARNFGNVSRFINHSCSPNVFWQPVLHDHGDDNFPHIMFFALKHIPPMTELTYDYGPGTTESDKWEMNSISKSRECLCGSPNCRGVFIS